MHPCHATRPLNISTDPGEASRFELPRARPHRRLRRLLRRLQPAHDGAQCGEQAGGAQSPSRVPAAVAAGAPGSCRPSWQRTSRSGSGAPSNPYPNPN
eukprot:scaffold109418_cov48-Phaeocystis_antarctica.AAC.1